MRRVAASILGVALLGVLVVGTASADTSEPTEPFDQTTASASGPWTDPTSTLTYDVAVDVTRSELTGELSAAMSFSRFDPTIVCDIGDPTDPDDDLVGADFSFVGTGSAPDVRLSVDSRLASAVGTATVLGQEQWRDECGNTTIGATRSFVISIDLTATSNTTRDRARSTEVLADGTILVRSYSLAIRSAEGFLTIDGVTSPATGAILRQSMTIRTR